MQYVKSNFFKEMKIRFAEKNNIDLIITSFLTTVFRILMLKTCTLQNYKIKPKLYLDSICFYCLFWPSSNKMIDKKVLCIFCNYFEITGFDIILVWKSEQKRQSINWSSLPFKAWWISLTETLILIWRP